MSARWVSVVVLWATVSVADAPWVSGGARMGTGVHVDGWAGTSTAGLAASRGSGASATGFEALWSYRDRYGELRGARSWRLTEGRVGAISGFVGGSVILVPDAPLGAGLGPHAGLSFALGSKVISFEFTVTTGAELFAARQPLRLVERIGAGVRVSAKHVRVSLLGRAGADVLPGHGFVGRWEAVLSLGWAVERRE